MRKINTKDVFKLARIIKAAGIKNLVSDMFAKGISLSKDLEIPEGATEEEISHKKLEVQKVQQEFGVNVIFTIMEACSDSKMEDRLYDLIGGIVEKPPEEIGKQSLERTIQDIKDIVSENDIIAFFKQAGQLTN